jgi:hypothetical protein
MKFILPTDVCTVAIDLCGSSAEGFQDAFGMLIPNISSNYICKVYLVTYSAIPPLKYNLWYCDVRAESRSGGAGADVHCWATARKLRSHYNE